MKCNMENERWAWNNENGALKIIFWHQILIPTWKLQQFFASLICYVLSSSLPSRTRTAHPIATRPMPLDYEPRSRIPTVQIARVTRVFQQPRGCSSHWPTPMSLGQHLHLCHPQHQSKVPPVTVAPAVATPRVQRHQLRCRRRATS